MSETTIDCCIKYRPRPASNTIYMTWQRPSASNREKKISIFKYDSCEKKLKRQVGLDVAAVSVFASNIEQSR